MPRAARGTLSSRPAIEGCFAGRPLAHGSANWLMLCGCMQVDRMFEALASRARREIACLVEAGLTTQELARLTLSESRRFGVCCIS